MLGDGAGDTEALLLAARDIGATAGDVGMIFLRHFFDEIGGLGDLSGSFHFFVGKTRVAEGDIGLDGAGEKHAALGDKTDFAH